MQACCWRACGVDEEQGGVEWPPNATPRHEPSTAEDAGWSIYNRPVAVKPAFKFTNRHGASHVGQLRHDLAREEEEDGDELHYSTAEEEDEAVGKESERRCSRAIGCGGYTR
jgi:hypothetical protein